MTFYAWMVELPQLLDRKIHVQILLEFLSFYSVDWIIEEALRQREFPFHKTDFPLMWSIWIHLL